MDPRYVLIQHGFVYRLENGRYITRARRGRLLPGAPKPAEMIEAWLPLENVQQYFYPPEGDFQMASDYCGWQWLRASEVDRWAGRLDEEQTRYVRSFA
jgi:hypothetical protein